MTESQTDYDIQKICVLEARIRKLEPPAFKSNKKIEPLQLIMVENQNLKLENEDHYVRNDENYNEKKENIDSIDLKTNQKLKELSLAAETEEKVLIPTEKLGKIQEISPNDRAKLATENKRYVKRRLDLDYDPLKKPKNIQNELKKLNFDEKNVFNNISDNSNDGINFHHNNLANNTKITDYFEMKKNRKLENFDKKIDFKSIRTSKQLKKNQNPIISLMMKKTNVENIQKVENEVLKKENSSSNSNQVPEYMGENLRLKEEIRKLNKKILDKDNQINEGQSHFNELIQENKGLQENVKYYEDYLSVKFVQFFSGF